MTLSHFLLILIATPVWLLVAAVWWNAKTALIQEDWQWLDPVKQPLKKEHKS